MPFRSWQHWGALPSVCTDTPHTHHGLCLYTQTVRLLPPPGSLASLEPIPRALGRAIRSGLDAEEGPTLRVLTRPAS